MREGVLSNLNTEREAVARGHIYLSNEKTSEFCSRKAVYVKSWGRKKFLGYTRQCSLEREQGPIPGSHNSPRHPFLKSRPKGEGEPETQQ